MNKVRDLAWATLGETGVVLIVCAVAWAIRNPLIFTSLGPTVYEMVEQPHQKSARLYNVLVGHLIALGCGFLALYVLGAFGQPQVESSGILTSTRLWAIALAVALTTIFTLLAKASQPAALSTALLIALGSMQTSRDAWCIAAGIILIALLGEPVRRIRLKQLGPRQAPSQT